MAPGAKPKPKPKAKPKPKPKAKPKNVKAKNINPRGSAFACPFAGTDRASIDPKKGVNWHLELYKISDYSFTGCYLTEKIKPADKDNFTSASGNVSNHWTKLYNDLRKLPGAWGFAFWHM